MRPFTLVTAAALVAGPLFAAAEPAGTEPATTAPPTVVAPIPVAPVAAEPTPVEPAAAAPALAAPVPVAPAPPLAEAQALVREFSETLKGELEAAIRSGGPVQAVVVCKERAPAIAADLSARSGWSVTRVSLRARNLLTGQPDAWEQAVLTGFEARQAGGEPAGTLVAAEVIEQDGARRSRFMKAIPTAEVCLACHGSELTPEVAAALDQAYPGDRARGYAVGEIRGAFSLAKPLD